jgi:hypothetical protein
VVIISICYYYGFFPMCKRRLAAPVVCLKYYNTWAQRILVEVQYIYAVESHFGALGVWRLGVLLS